MAQQKNILTFNINAQITYVWLYRTEHPISFLFRKTLQTLKTALVLRFILSLKLLRDGSVK